jgi:hypothetical protein
VLEGLLAPSLQMALINSFERKLRKGMPDIAVHRFICREIRPKPPGGLPGDGSPLPRTAARKRATLVTQNRIYEQKKYCTASSRANGAHGFIHRRG